MIISSGITSDGIILSYDTLYDLNVLDGGSVNNTTVVDYGYMTVSSGGTANSTTVDSCGGMYVYSGGTAISTLVNASGDFSIYKNGLATLIIENGGYVYVASGAEASFASNTFSDLVLKWWSATVHSGTTANNTTLSGGSLYVYAGGEANSTTMYNYGELHVFSGGTVNDTIVNSGFMSVYGNGQADRITVNPGGHIYVSSGGTATQIIENGGYVEVLEGGTATLVPNTFSGVIGFINTATVHSCTVASDIVVCSSAILEVYGGTVSNAQVGGESSATINVFWGSADGIELLQKGRMNISSGGTANKVTVNFNGTLTISSGATATEVLEKGGYVFVEDGAEVTFLPNSISDLSIGNFESATAHSGTIVTGVTIRGKGCGISVCNGGVASDISVTGVLDWNIYIGYLDVNPGGLVTGVSINSYGSCIISSGGTVSDIEMNQKGKMNVFSGASVTGIVENGGFVNIEDGAIVSITPHSISSIVLSGSEASATVHAGTVMTHATIDNGGRMYVFSGGKTDDIVVRTGGGLTVASGGTATDIDWTPTEGSINIESGAYATFASQFSGVYYGSGKLIYHSETVDGMSAERGHTMYVMFGGEANNVPAVDGVLEVWSGGVLNGANINAAGYWYEYGAIAVSSGGVANDIKVNAGHLIVSRGGTANDVTIEGGKSAGVFVLGGGIVNDVTVNDRNIDVYQDGEVNQATILRGAMNVFYGGVANGGTVGGNTGYWASLNISGGTANDIAVVNSGLIHVSEGGTMNRARVNQGGNLNVSSGGIAVDAVIHAEGRLNVLENGTLRGGTVNEQGYLIVKKGGKLTGRMTLKSGAVVSAESGGIVDFDLTRTMVDADVLINDLSLIQGTPTYTLTIDGQQKSGEYYLAKGASGFDQLITITGMTAEEEPVTLSVGQTANYEGVDYTLNLVDGDSLELLVVRSFCIYRNSLIHDHINKNNNGNITLTFSEEIDVSAFSTDLVSLMDKNGTSISITGFEIDGRKLTLYHVPLTVEGSYELKVSEQLKSIHGHTLDQNENSIANEAEDAYTLQITADFTAPRVVNVSPDEDFAGTLTTLQITFSSAVDFDSVSGQISLICPDGQEIIPTSYRQLTASCIEVTVPEQTAYGQYKIKVGSRICDLAGNCLDQNGDGVFGGEDDVFFSTFNITEIDLKVSDVSLEKNVFQPGEKVSVRWTDYNDGGYSLSGSWTDGVYLSADARWDVNDILLGNLTHEGGLSQNQLLSNSIDVSLAGVPTGTYYLLVRSDIYMQEKGDRESASAAQNLEAVKIEVVLPGLVADGTVSGHVSTSGDYAVYHFTQNANESLRLVLDSKTDSASMEIYVGYGFVPTREKYDSKAQKLTDGTLFLNAPDSTQNLYVMVYNKSADAEFDYDLSVESVPMSITQVSGSGQSNRNGTSLELTGVDFAPNMTVSLIDQSGKEISADALVFIDNTRVKIEFASGTLQEGDYTLKCSVGNETAFAPELVSIINGAESILDMWFSTPAVVGRHAIANLDLTSTNTGTDILDSVLVVVSPTQSHQNKPDTTGAILTLDKSRIIDGFWTSTMPEGYSQSVSFLVSGDSPGLIMPGETVTNTVYYGGWIASDWDFGDSHINWNASYISTDSTEQLDWMEALASSGYSANTQAMLAANLSLSVGDTWGNYVKNLSRNLRCLDDMGASTDGLSAAELLNYEIKQDAGVLSPYRTLLDVTDLTTIVPGALSFGISRSFNSDLLSRDQCGSFGYGWVTSLDTILEIDSGGDVCFVQGGSSRLYQPNYSNGYQTVAGDGSEMKKTKDGYQLTERNGIVYRFDEAGKLLTVADCNGNTITCIYDEASQIVKIAHSSGEAISLTRNEAGFITQAVSRSGKSVSYAYDDSGNLVEAIDGRSGNSVSYSYSSSLAHALTSFVDATGSEYVYTYGDNGLLSGISSRDGAYSVSIAYGADGDVTVTDSQNSCVTYYYDNCSRICRSRNAVSGVITYFRYDEDGNLKSLYDSRGNAVSFTYDALGQLVSSTDVNGNVVKITYTASGYTAGVTDVRGNLTEYTYNAKNNLTGVYYADNTCETYTYDLAGNVRSFVNVKGVETVYSYDKHGNVTSVQSEGRTTSYSYDAFGNLIGVTYADGATCNYGFNSLDLMTGFTDANGNVTSYTYSPAGDLTCIVYADGSAESFANNGSNDLVSWTNRRGGTVDYTVNPLGYKTMVTQSDGTVFSYAYDDSGRMTAAGDLSFSYNAYDVLTKVESTDGNRNIKYAYDTQDRVISVSDGVNTTNYSYTVYGGIDKLTDAQGKLIADYDYDRFGNLTKITNGNGTSVVYSYNDYQELVSIETFDTSGASTGRTAYDYNSEGLVTGKITSDGTWSYTYDKVGQLTEAVLTKDDTVVRCEAYTYDAMGNRLTATIDGATTTYAYNNMNQIVSANGFEYRYDADGNLLEDELRTYTWTADNRVASETLKSTDQVWEYGYDALGNRTHVTTNGVTTTYTVDPNGNVLAEYVDGVFVRSYIQGNQLVAFTDADGNTYYFNSDMLGSTTGITDATGITVNSYSYDSFGNVLNSTEGVANDFEFVGGYGLMANASGTTFVRARNYDPVTGRWTSADPIGINGGGNLYAYCGNDSISSLDANGTVAVAVALPALAVSVPVAATAIMVGTAIVGAALMMNTGPITPITFPVYNPNRVNPVTPGGNPGNGQQNPETKEPEKQTPKKEEKKPGKKEEGSIFETKPGQKPGGPGQEGGGGGINYLASIAPLGIPIPSENSGHAHSNDPNDKTVTEGFGEAGFVSAGSVLNYKVEFENDPEWANAPARWVRVYDTLAEEFDLDTFELKSICIAGNYIEVGDGRDSYNELRELSINGEKVLTQISINLDAETRQLFAEFTAIDPDTGWMLQDVLRGILLPNDEIGSGEGFFTYSVALKEDVAHGTEITNTAKIYFDFNDPIDTPTTLNTVDAANPSAAFNASVSGAEITLTLNGTDADSGIAGYDIMYSTDGEIFSVFGYSSAATVSMSGEMDTVYYFKVRAVDNVGNVSEWSKARSVRISNSPLNNLSGSKAGLTWDPIDGASGYVVEYSLDDFEHFVRFTTESNSLDSFCLPAGNYQWRVRVADDDEWVTGDTIAADAETTAPQLIQSDENGKDDLFFASPNGTWSSIYYAQHVGSVNDWSGTNELVSANGKGRIQNLYFGSADPNVLCLTDGENGDAIFVDDVYTDLPESVAEHTARLYKIQEVRAGAGDDIVDMTSQRFEYIGDGLTIRGGEGNDTIWANKGDNWLFGDAGNDRIVGASGNDVIAGGIGNDRMHGGGGNDVFTFCDNWGVDNVEQLATGSVMLWFAEGSKDKWDEATMTYADGENSVKVSGVAAEKVTLKFGDDGSSQYKDLASFGAFAEFTSQKIFENADTTTGAIASLE